LRITRGKDSRGAFTGWISYAYGRAGMRDGGEPAGSNDRFLSEFDQRHTVNFLRRLSPETHCQPEHPMELRERLSDPRLSPEERIPL
jgi:hypothetical protein